MCEVLDKIENRGISKGITKGENNAFSLVKFLISNNRIDDLEKASEDEAYRNKLMAELFPNKPDDK